MYDYKQGKKRIEKILDSDLKVLEEKIPSDEKFTFSNGYYDWVSAIFVDIRKSSEIFSNENKVHVSKMIRSFTSEVIEILRNAENLREIGIRGDCVYAIYNTPNTKDEYEIANIAFYINTLMKMLNIILLSRGLKKINVGVGVATAKELVIKAGREGVGINNKVWIGEAVTKASNLSSLGLKDGNESLIFSLSSYEHFIDSMIKSDSNAPLWFEKKYSNTYGYYYSANVIKTEFNDWIIEGMRE